MRPKTSPRKLPDFTNWLDKELFPEDFIYYKKTKRYIECLCSHCGRRFTLDRYSEHDKWYFMDPDEVMHNNGGNCPLCHRQIIFRAKGRSKIPRTVFRYFLYGEKHGEKVMMRLICARKGYTNENKASYRVTEEARVTFGEKEYPWKQKIDYYGNMCYGNKSERFGDLKDGVMHPSVWKVIGKSYLNKFDVGTIYENMSYWYTTAMYCEYEAHSMKLLLILSYCSRHPDIEYMIKSGFGRLAEAVIKGGIKLKKGSKPYQIFNVLPDRVKDLKVHPERLSFYQDEKEQGKHYKPEEIEYLADLSYYRRGTVSAVEQYASIIKQKHYLEKQQEKQKGRTILQLLDTWADYLRMKSGEGYEMDSIAAFPKDLIAAHDAIRDEISERQKHEKEKKLREMYKGIQKNYRKDSEFYAFESDGLSVRLARNAGEFVKEGTALHHCVGASDRYMKEMANGISYILFLRTDPKTPYITIQMSCKDYRIIQWYGAYDKKPDRPKIDKWLSAYQKHLRQQAKKVKKGA